MGFGQELYYRSVWSIPPFGDSFLHLSYPPHFVCAEEYRAAGRIGTLSVRFERCDFSSDDNSLGD